MWLDASSWCFWEVNYLWFVLEYNVQFCTTKLLSSRTKWVIGQNMIQKYDLHLPVYWGKRFPFEEIQSILWVLHFCDDSASTKYNYGNVSRIQSLCKCIFGSIVIRCLSNSDQYLRGDDCLSEVIEMLARTWCSAEVMYLWLSSCGWTAVTFHVFF